jgi:hypothetical protein
MKAEAFDRSNGPSGHKIPANRSGFGRQSVKASFWHKTCEKGKGQPGHLLKRTLQTGTRSFK